MVETLTPKIWDLAVQWPAAPGHSLPQLRLSATDNRTDLPAANGQLPTSEEDGARAAARDWDDATQIDRVKLAAVVRGAASSVAERRSGAGPSAAVSPS